MSRDSYGNKGGSRGMPYSGGNRGEEVPDYQDFGGSGRAGQGSQGYGQGSYGHGGYGQSGTNYGQGQGHGGGGGYGRTGLGGYGSYGSGNDKSYEIEHQGWTQWPPQTELLSLARLFCSDSCNFFLPTH